MTDQKTEGAEQEETVSITVDGQPFEAKPGELVIAAAERQGVYIPRFCYHPRMRPVAMCRMCLVEVKTPKGFMLQPACYVPVAPDMEVVTTSAAVKKAQDGVLEFLLVNHPLDCPVCDKGGECPLQDQTLAYGPGESRYVEEKRHFAKPIPLSSLVDLDRERCIQCDRCTRFAEEVAGDPLIEFMGRSDELEVNTFPDHPFASYFSGNTVQICPVGALTARPYRFKARPWDLEQVESTCTSCAFGCRVAVQSSSNALTRYIGIDSDPVNHGWLCDMGRFDFEAVNSDGRLGRPLVRRSGAESGDDHLAEASWGEALKVAAGGIEQARSVHGPEAVAVLGGARLPNEDAYAWAKLAKSVIGTDNVDAQLGDGLPAEAVLGLPRASIDDACRAPAVVLLAPDLKEELPVLFLRLRAAAINRDMPIVELAPQRSGMSRYCRTTLAYRPGEVPALARALVDGSQPDVAGVSAGSVARVQELLGDVEGVVVVLGRPSLAESAESVAAAAGALSELPGVRFLPALRRANVMGALDMGLAPGILPGRVSLAGGRQWFSREWGTIPEDRGLDTAGVLTAAAQGRIQGLVLLGADPVSDFPDRQLARQALAGAGFVVAVDTFLTPSSRQADVVLPAASYAERPGTTTNIEGRITRLGQKVVAPGVARPDWMIAADLASRLGAGLGVESVEELWDEIERLAPSHAGVTRAVLADRRHRDGVVAPLSDGAGPDVTTPSPAGATDTDVGAGAGGPALIDPMGTPGLLETATQGVPATAVVAAEPEDLGEGSEGPSQGQHQSAETRPTPLAFSPPEDVALPPVDAYSLRLISHRTLYGKGTLIQNAPSLAELAPPTRARANPHDLDRLGAGQGSRLRVRSRRATLVLEVVADVGVPPGSISVPFNAVGEDAGELIDVGRPIVEVRLETP
ncbi:MAG: NADH-quinone oxidoreductase subunit NuoG [Actinomycetota bacterium]|nr:NADH-quinone oxidoreductase subunit NuoG [Actinomycetota bacterium]